MSVIVFLDGVIRKNKDQSIIMEGASLYKSLNETNRVIILADDKERADVWLKLHNLAKKTDDIVEVVDSPLDNPVLLTIEMLRSKGKIDYVVTEDTELTVKLLERGINVLVFLNPRYTRPEFRPDSRGGVRSWADITTELDKQQGLYDEDKRLREDAVTEDGI